MDTASKHSLNPFIYTPQTQQQGQEILEGAQEASNTRPNTAQSDAVNSAKYNTDARYQAIVKVYDEVLVNYHEAVQERSSYIHDLQQNIVKQSEDLRLAITKLEELSVEHAKHMSIMQEVINKQGTFGSIYAKISEIANIVELRTDKIKKSIATEIKGDYRNTFGELRVHGTASAPKPTISVSVDEGISLKEAQDDIGNILQELKDKCTRAGRVFDKDKYLATFVNEIGAVDQQFVENDIWIHAWLCAYWKNNVAYLTTLVDNEGADCRFLINRGNEPMTKNTAIGLLPQVKTALNKVRGPKSLEAQATMVIPPARKANEPRSRTNMATKTAEELYAEYDRLMETTDLCPGLRRLN